MHNLRMWRLRRCRTMQWFWVMYLGRQKVRWWCFTIFSELRVQHIHRFFQPYLVALVALRLSPAISKHGYTRPESFNHDISRTVLGELIKCPLKHSGNDYSAGLVVFQVDGRLICRGEYQVDYWFDLWRLRIAYCCSAVIHDIVTGLL